MATAVPNPSDALLPRTAEPVVHGRRTLSRAVRTSLRTFRVLRDQYLVYTAALVPIAVAVAVVSGRLADVAAVGILAPLFVSVQLLLGLVPARRRPLTPMGWSFLRLAVTLLFIGGLVEWVGGPAKPLVALYVPLVVAAAAVGTVPAIVMGAVASFIYLAPEIVRMGDPAELPLRGITLAGVSILVAIGTRHLVDVVEERSRRVRTSMLAERRRSRQIAGMETVSRVLVAGGPVHELLDRVLGVLVDRFGYHHVSIYLFDGSVLRLGAQRGYEKPILVFDGSAGIVGRTLRSRDLVYVPDVREDPDYLPVQGDVVSEICAPLVVDGEFLGILNVEARDRLDRTDRDLIGTLAGRVATVVALGRDREALAERERLFHKMHDFTQAVSGTLNIDELAAAIVEAAGRVIPADIVALTILDRESGRYLVRAAANATPEQLGREVRPGESLAGRAIRDRSVVLDDQFSMANSPASYAEFASDRRPLAGAGIPLVRDGVVVGALTLARRLPAEAFRPTEREAMDLLAGHAALAVANAFLHADVAELAIRDSLTGLYNRRYFDESLDRIVAAWRRADPDLRAPVSAITFDLDHFGEFNKLHGHQVGDRVLRAFAEILHGRFRTSDLVARLGGEEFIVVLEGAAQEDALRIAEEVRASLRELDLRNDQGERLVVTVSAGCAVLEEAGDTREQLLRTADVGLFMAKRAGRDRVVAA
jgi:diguanylate cyclase (GGDEF)-like protein